LTSSFPSSPRDETCGYIRDLARSLSEEFNVKILAPPDHRALPWPADSFTLFRSRSILPPALDPFQASDDLNQLTRASLFINAAAFASVVCFFVRALVLSIRADVICSHWMVPSGLIGAVISRVLGKKHVMIEHSGALHLIARMCGGSLIARFIVDSSDRIVTVSAYLKRKLLAMCPAADSKTAVVPMGVDSNDVPARDNDGTQVRRRTILFVGRLVEVKGLEVLFDAVAGLDTKLIVAGDGERRAEFERLSRHLRVNPTFVGSRDAQQRSELFATCDAVVIPSRVLADGRTEGMPVVCLEAMAAGKVVIASRVGGLAEVIVDGENGLLFEAGDHHMLRDKLMLAFGDDSLRKRIRENARRTAEDYDWSKIGRQFSEIIFSSLSHRGSCIAKGRTQTAIPEG